MKKTTLLILFLFGLVANSFSQAGLCEEAVSVSLPYSTTDDTANYANNYHGTPGESGCGTPNNFLGGNDVVYAYTATFNGSINVLLSTDSSYVGLFAYASCLDIGQNCLAGTVMEDINSAGYLSLEAFPVTNRLTYYFVVSSWPDPQTVTYHLNISENSCVNATATYTVISDCSVAEQFFVSVNISDLGSAFALTASDDYGSATQTVSDPGVLVFGPYPNATPVVIILTNDEDPNCFLTSAPQTQLICAPVNNFCDHAIDLALETSPLIGTTIGATNQNNTSCSTNRAAGDVYYKMLVPNTYTLTIGNTFTDYDAIVTTFFGNCDNQIELGCTDDDFEVYRYVNNTGTDQTFYWVQDGFNGQTGAFELNWNLTDCVTPDAIYTIVPDCANGEQFLVDANIFSLGSATSVAISDDQGSAPQTATETGLVHFGPYPNGTPVVFTATNNDDATCFLTSPEVVQYECPSTCTNATVTYEVALDCPNEGFFIKVTVADLGSATAVTISDNQGSENQNIAVAGVYLFGPYPNYTAVTFTVSNDDDGDCVLTNEVISYSVCPPPNDSCANAIALISGSDMISAAVRGSSEGATLSTELPIPTCSNMYFSVFGKDVWYTVTIPTSGNITVETAASGDSGFAVVTDTVLQLYSGNCSGLTPINCDNDGGSDQYSLVSASGRAPGEILYVRAFGTNGTQGSFMISAYDGSLATTSFDHKDLAYFPNPVKDILNLSYQKKITKVAVFNILGQEVIANNVGSNESKIDMSGLPKGTYLVKITADGQMKTIKVIKE